MSQYLIRQRVRPKSLMFLVPPNGKSLIRQLMRYCCTIWGGYQNAIIPVQMGRIEKPWRDLFLHADPDMIYLDSSLPKLDLSDCQVQKKLAHHRLARRDLKTRFEPGGHGPKSNMSMLTILGYVSGKYPEVRAIWPRLRESSLLSDVVLTNLGGMTDPVSDYLLKYIPGLSAKRPLIETSGQLVQYLSLSGREFLWTLIGQTAFFSPKGPPSAPHNLLAGLEIYVSESVLDALYCWNVRTVACPFELSNLYCVWLPTRLLRHCRDQLIDFARKYVKRCRDFGPSRVSLHSVASRQAIDRAKQILSGSIELANEPFKPSRCFAFLQHVKTKFTAVDQEQTSFAHDKSSIRIRRPEFAASPGAPLGTYCLDVQLESRKTGLVISVVPSCTLGKLFFKSKESDGLSRVTKDLWASVLIGSGKQFINVSIPSRRKVFEYLIEREGTAGVYDRTTDLSFRDLSEVGRSASGIVEVFGGSEYAWSILRRKGWRDRFEILSTGKYSIDTDTEDQWSNRLQKIFGRHDQENDALFSAILEEFRKAARGQIRPKPLAVEDLIQSFGNWFEVDRGTLPFHDYYSKLRGRIVKELNRHRLHSLTRLVELGVLLRGFETKCPNCGQVEWKALGEVSDTYRCSGCGNQETTPIEVGWKYRLNTLISDGFMNKGVVPLLLAFGELTRSAQHYSQLFSFELQDDSKQIFPGGRGEVDGLVVSDGRLVVLDVKTKARQFDNRQLISTYAFAERIHADIVFLACMDGFFPDQTVARISNLPRPETFEVQLMPLTLRYEWPKGARYYHHPHCPKLRRRKKPFRIYREGTDERPENLLRCQYCLKGEAFRFGSNEITVRPLHRHPHIAPVSILR